MKTIITALSVLTLGTTVGNLSNILNANQNMTIKSNCASSITQQATIYIDKNGKKIPTNERDLSKIESKEVVQIGFYQNKERQIEAVRMPRTIEKVPNQLPPEITSLHTMFAGATSFNQDLSKWDTSHIADMRFMFNGATSFNGNIANWNVANVTNMFVMFAGATSFNQDLSKWDTSHVIHFSLMFYKAISFNQNISGWNTGNAVDMSHMFYYAESFNQNLSQWNVKQIKDHSNFAEGSPIADQDNKLPKFNNTL